MALLRVNSRDPRSPQILGRGQNAQLVVDQHIVFGRIPRFYVVQFLLLMHIDQYVAIHCIKETGALDLVRLENRISI